MLEISSLPNSSRPSAAPPARPLVASAPAPLPPVDQLDAVSRAHILSVLEATGWIIAGPTGAAARLGTKRSTLNFRMKELGIVRPSSSVTA